MLLFNGMIAQLPRRLYVQYRIASQGNNANIAFNNYSSAGSFSSQITAMEILA